MGNNFYLDFFVLYWNSPRWLNTVTGDEAGIKSELISNPSSPRYPMKGCTTPPASTPPSLYAQQCGFFFVYDPQESELWKSCETEPTVFRPYLGRLECLSICRCHNKGSTFSSVILIPWVLGRPGFEPGTSRSADRPLSNWANRPPVSLTEQSSFSDISSTSKWWPG